MPIILTIAALLLLAALLGPVVAHTVPTLVRPYAAAAPASPVAASNLRRVNRDGDEDMGWDLSGRWMAPRGGAGAVGAPVSTLP